MHEGRKEQKDESGRYLGEMETAETGKEGHKTENEIRIRGNEADRLENETRRI